MRSCEVAMIHPDWLVSLWLLEMAGPTGVSSIGALVGWWLFWTLSLYMADVSGWLALVRHASHPFGTLTKTQTPHWTSIPRLWHSWWTFEDSRDTPLHKKKRKPH